MLQLFERDNRPHERGPHGWRRRRYSTVELRAIRKAKGVGRPIKRVVWDITGEAEATDRQWSWLWYAKQVNEMYVKWRGTKG